MLSLVKGCSYIMTERVQFDSGNQTCHSKKPGKKNKKISAILACQKRKGQSHRLTRSVSVQFSRSARSRKKGGKQRAVMVLTQQHTSKILEYDQIVNSKTYWTHMETNCSHKPTGFQGFGFVGITFTSLRFGFFLSSPSDCLCWGPVLLLSPYVVGHGHLMKRNLDFKLKNKKLMLNVNLFCTEG